MDLVVITPEISHPDEILLIHTFFTNGLLKLHIRKPNFSTEDYRLFLHKIDEQFHSFISIHGSFELLKEFPELGVHITSRKRENEKNLAFMNSLSPSTLSTSFHSLEEIKKNESAFDYVFISPVFDSISKKGYHASINMSGVKKLKKEMTDGQIMETSILGLGGVNSNNIQVLYQNGFDGAAVLGAVWESANPVNSFLEIQESIKKYRDG